MPVGRYARHTQIPVESYRQRLKEVVVQANQMYGRPYGIAADPTAGIEYNSPYQSFDPDTVQGICCDIKLPLDRVMGTQTKFYFVYYIPTGPGGNNILWRLDYLFRREGNILNVVPSTRSVLSPTDSRYKITRSPPILFDDWELDWYQQNNEGQPCDLQLGVIRWANDATDDEPSAARLLKLIMEYVGYE